MKRKLLLLAGLASAVVLVNSYVITSTVVIGESMLPTLHPWEVCWMQRVQPYAPARGDIVMFRTADDPPLRFIKRVIALPGETIAIEAGQVLINSQPLSEPYTTGNPAWSLAATNVPPGKVYVIGDHRTVPMAITVQGLVATRLMQGRLIAHWRWRE